MSEPYESTTTDDTGQLDEELIQAASQPPGSTNIHVEAIASAIGPRPPGSQEERDAADYLVGALDDVDLPAARLKASAPGSTQLADILLGGIALLAIMVAFLVPAAGLILLGAVLITMLAEHSGRLNLTQYLPDTDTINVLSIVPPAETEVRRLIVTSTLDSGVTGLLAKRHRSDLYDWLHAGMIGAVALALLATLVLLVDSGSSLRLALLLPFIACAVVLALLVEREMSKSRSPGAISNASGVAAMVEIARATVAAPPRWLEVWFLGVGASSSRGGGMTDFLSRNTFDPDTTYFVHLHSPGGGSPVVPKTTGVGMQTAPATPLLTWIFDSVMSNHDNPANTGPQRLAATTLALHTHRSGYQSIVIAGTDERGQIPYLDHEEDRSYRVDDECINEAARVVSLAIDALDREVAARAMLARSTATVQKTSPVSTNVHDEGLPTPAG